MSSRRDKGVRVFEGFLDQKLAKRDGISYSIMKNSPPYDHARRVLCRRGPVPTLSGYVKGKDEESD